MHHWRGAGHPNTLQSQPGDWLAFQHHGQRSQWLSLKGTCLVLVLGRVIYKASLPCFFLSFPNTVKSKSQGFSPFLPPQDTGTITEKRGKKGAL